MPKTLFLFFCAFVFPFLLIAQNKASKTNVQPKHVGTFANTPPSNPIICATAGADGATNISGSINTYFPPLGNIILSAGSTNITLAAVPATDTHGNSFGSVPIKTGDLLLIVQVQDATINYDNSVLYGAGNSNSGPDGLGATGFTDAGSSGKFEYIVATNSVPLTGGVLNFKGSGVGGGTVYTYTNAAATSNRGKRAFQVLRVPQYSNLRLTSTISPPPFNGIAGGIIAFEVAGNMDFNGFTIDVSARGFRGGYSLVKPSAANISDLYVTSANDNRASGKGEGIAGTPRYVWDGFNEVNTGIEGLPGGSGGRGAPANAGGGGNDSNAGGGGGANGEDGGVGGLGYDPIGGIQPSSGRPGSKSFAGATPDFTALIMGGGGGGGHANDALTGVKGGVGGGVIVINSRTISGNGTILANGANGAPGAFGSHPDGSGGGGAGGTVFLKISNSSPTANIIIQARGGKGGNTEGDGSSGVSPHGPGGGGSGGVIFYNVPSGTVQTNIAGGQSGKTDSGTGITHGATNGKLGYVSTLNVAALPPYLQDGTTICFPLLTTTMSILNKVTPKPAGGTAVYSINITNDPSAGTAGGVQGQIALPVGFNYQSATVAYQGTATGPASLTNTGTAQKPIIGNFIIPAGGTVTITLTVGIDCVAPGIYNSSVQAVYFDPTRDYTQPNRQITAKTNAFAGSNTSYQTASFGNVTGSNYNGNTATAEDATVTNLAVSNNSITQTPANQYFCTVGGDPGLITGSTPTVVGTYTYQWQSSTDNISFNNITGATLKDYDPPVINATTYYRRTVTPSNCPAPFVSNVIKVEVFPVLANNVIAAPVINTFCGSGDPTAITGNIPSGGDGTYTYQWQSSTDNSTFTDISGETGKNYDPGILNSVTYFRRIVYSTACNTSLTSNVVTISVQSAVANNQLTDPLSGTFCTTGNPTIITGSTPTGGSGTYTYQWQRSIDNTTFADISGATAKDYDPPIVNVTTYYRRSVASGACNIPVLSNVITIKVEPALAGNGITAPAVNSFCLASDPAVITGSVPTGGNGTYVYQWQSSTDNVIFTNIPGALSKDYDPSLVSVTTYYRRQVSSDACTVPLTSNVVTIQIQGNAAITNNVITAPTIVTFCVTGNAAVITGNTPSGGTGVFTYQWQRSADNATFTDISGATGINYDPPVITASTWYRRVASSGNCVTAVISNVVEIEVQPAIAGNVITAPAVASFCANGDPATITGSLPTGGDGIYNYQWQSSTDNITFTDVTGAYSKDLDPVVITATTYYRRMVNSGGCSTPVASNVITITVLPAISNNKITAPAISAVCVSGNPDVIIGNVPSGGDGTYTYQWQSSADNVTFVDIAGAVAKNYDPAVINSTIYYRRMVFSGICNTPVASNVVKIDVQAALSNNVLTAPIKTDFCSPGDAAVITGSIPAGGNGTYAYQWQRSTDNIAFTDIAGATLKDYDPVVETATVYYRRTVTSGACTVPALSNVIIIAVEPPLANNTITPPAVIVFCSASDPAVITGNVPTGGNGTYNYQWQRSADNITYADIAGATAKDYNPPVVNATTYFRRTVTSGACTIPLTSNVVEIQIQSGNAISNNLITAPAITTFCVSGNPAIIIGNTPSGGTGTFTYQWQQSADGVSFVDIANATGINYDPGVVAADTWYRRIASSGICVTGSVSNVISIKIQQALANNLVVAPGISRFCSTGDPALIIGNVPSGGDGTYNYQWQKSTDNITFTDIAGVNTKDYDPTVITVTTYYRRIVTSGSCTVPLTGNVITITIETAVANNSITAPPVSSFCSTGDAASIIGSTPTGGNAVYSYQWQVSADNVSFINIAGETSKNYDPPVVTSDTYYRRLVTSGTCTAPVLSNVVTIKVLSTPSAPLFVTASPSVCPGGSTTLTISNPQSALTYNWYSSATKANLLFSGTSYPTGPLNTATSYYVEASNGTCNSSLAVIQVTMAPVPGAPVAVKNPVNVCVGLEATALVQSPQNGFTYNWYKNAADVTPVHTGTSFTTQAVNISVTYYVEAVNAGGCSSSVRTAVNIVPLALPDVTPVGKAICPGGNTTLTANPSDADAVISWYASATSPTALHTGSSFTTPNLSSNTTYYIEAVNSANCSTPARVKVEVTMLKQLDAPQVSVDATTNNSITFKWDAVAGAQGYQVSIDNGQTFIPPSSGADGLSHTVNGLQLNQQVTVLVQALGASDCQLSGSSTAVTGTAVSPLGTQIYVANTFTPNGDGNNDIVYVHGEGIKSMTFYVYDQWGELIFTSTNMNKGWDGYFKGTREPVGVYVYYVRAIVNDGTQLTKKGTITLLR